MQKELTTKLMEFGFTVNQAKVYLSILQLGKTDVGQISKNTLLHRQDIYKLLPKLEKMGLITRTISKPVLVEALPLEQSLERLIKKEKDAEDKRISVLENNLIDITKEIRQQPKVTQETGFTLLTTNVALKNRINLTFKAKPGVFRIVSSVENLKGQAGQFYKQYFQLIADNRVKMQVILVGAENMVELKRMVEKLAPKTGAFFAKYIERCPSKDFQVVDSKEVWIATEQKTMEDYPVILWTNDSNIVRTYLESFNDVWTNPKAVTLMENKAKKPETLTAISA